MHRYVIDLENNITIYETGCDVPLAEGADPRRLTAGEVTRLFSISLLCGVVVCILSRRCISEDCCGLQHHRGFFVALSGAGARPRSTACRQARRFASCSSIRKSRSAARYSHSFAAQHWLRDALKPRTPDCGGLRVDFHRLDRGIDAACRRLGPPAHMAIALDRYQFRTGMRAE
jgi:hypothetical protein